MKDESLSPRQKGRILIFPPDDFKVILPFGVGVRADTCSFQITATGESRIVTAGLKEDPTLRIQINPVYSKVERITLNKAPTRVRFWVVLSDLDRLRVRQLIEREHYLMPTARGLFLACGVEEDSGKTKIIGVAVLDALLHGNPKLGRSQFATRVLGSDSWQDWPRNKIVDRLRLAWASRFAVHSSFQGCGIGTRLAVHLKTVARRFRLPVADFIEVITTERHQARAEADDSAAKRDFLVRAGYTRMAEPMKSSPMRILNLKTGYFDSVTARKHYYHVDIRKE